MTDLEALREKLEHLSPEDLHEVEELVERLAWRPSGNIIAANVSLEEYMERYAANFCEWVEGYVIQMSPASMRHNLLILYISTLLQAYMEMRPIGVLVPQPFVMRLPAFPNRRREPDLLVVLNSSESKLLPTYLDGPADLCIEVVSEESHDRDFGEKFREYEAGGVKEYWILDWLRKDSRFYLLSDAGHYVHQPEDANRNYHSPLLPGLVVHIPTLWQDELPGPSAVASAVKAMLGQA
jgi:Uma2 family endonuclease